jgi:hypothetical protein
MRPSIEKELRALLFEAESALAQVESAKAAWSCSDVNDSIESSAADLQRTIEMLKRKLKAISQDDSSDDRSTLS